MYIPPLLSAARAGQEVRGHPHFPPRRPVPITHIYDPHARVTPQMAEMQIEAQEKYQEMLEASKAAAERTEVMWAALQQMYTSHSALCTSNGVEAPPALPEEAVSYQSQATPPSVTQDQGLVDRRPSLDSNGKFRTENLTSKGVVKENAC